ncbi:uncharacterized protein LOC143516561 isoform X2 [Brachyhypopomus gauderio]|uniref:uncharacterized protein LOC143516561 isoform X2 n=1 Tax=Brachyhypopomus gauderio TaxID=698409 RepID=UPI00404290CD
MECGRLRRDTGGCGDERQGRLVRWRSGGIPYSTPPQRSGSRRSTTSRGSTAAPGSGKVGVCCVEIRQHSRAENIPRWTPGPLLGTISLPVYEVLESAPSTLRLQELSDDVRRPTVDFQGFWRANGHRGSGERTIVDRLQERDMEDRINTIVLCGQPYPLSWVIDQGWKTTAVRAEPACMQGTAQMDMCHLPDWGW